VVRFWRTVDRLASNSSSDLQDLNEVAAGQTFDQWLLNINTDRYKGYTQTGRVRVVNPAATRLGNGQYSVKACIDVSNTDLLDKKGKSVVATDRPPKIAYEYIVVQRGGPWYATRDKATGKC